MGARVIGKLRMAVVAALLLAAGNAWALGLGQIEVKSKRNQPLLAEIPIISTTPGELEALQARLASPDTFRRVGLAPPSGIAADLQFSLGSDARGRPVIRVTTVKPVEQATLNFLIEVDWGQGRLVREYSALVDAPNTASAPLQPAIDAPAVQAPNIVQRPAVVETPAAPQPIAAQPAPSAVAPAPAAEPAPAPVAAIPLPPPAAIPSAPAPASPEQYGPIKPGETLSKIAGGLGLPGGYSLDQTMLALLRANPDAFLGDDINRLKRGAVLRVPGSGEVAAIEADEAALVVRQQMQQWRQARRAVAQPDVAVVARDASNRDADNTPSAAPAPAAEPAAAKPAATKPAASAPRRQQAQARLQIVPPSAPGKTTATRSGTNSGGEGSMLQQQLRQKDEDIAAKSAEIGDLKERVAELEKMQQQQQQLLSMKDSELAAAQQRLADARKTAAATPATAAQTAQQAEKPQSSNPMPWVWGGLGLLALALLGWWFARRGSRPTPATPPRRGFDSEALAASMVTPAAPAPTPVSATKPAPAAPRTETVIDLADVPTTPTPRLETPTWHSSARVVQNEPAPSPPPAAPRFVPQADALAAPAPQASPEYRMKLARAFLDIGDEHSAKELLRELLDDSDPAARTEAARLLRELG